MTIIAIICSYLLGAIPFGYIVTKLWVNTDIRQHGSGNIGFTNVLRVAGKLAGLIVLFLDIGKGIASVLLISKLSSASQTLPISSLSMSISSLCGLAAIVGHNWSVYLKLKGGKGISTTIGVFLALNWQVTLVGIIVWFVIVFFTRYVSLGSILFVISLPITTALFHIMPQVKIENWTTILILSVITVVMAIYKHRGNIYRLFKGTERKIGQKVSIRE